MYPYNVNTLNKEPVVEATYDEKDAAYDYQDDMTAARYVPNPGYNRPPGNRDDYERPGRGWPPYPPGRPNRPERPKPTPGYEPPPYRPGPPTQLPGPEGPGDFRPTEPPPSLAPSKGPQLRAIDAGSIRGCMYNYTYVWLKNGSEFWFFPTYLGVKSIAGFRWVGYRWYYMGFDLNSIDAFSCSRY